MTYSTAIVIASKLEAYLCGRNAAISGLDENSNGLTSLELREAWDLGYKHGIKAAKLETDTTSSVPPSTAP